MSSTQDKAAAELASELFAPLGELAFRRMFGGTGIRADGAFFALIFEGEIYLKTDAELAQRIATMGGREFCWIKPSTGQTIRMSYWTLPETAVDDADQAEDLARRALEVARVAAAAKPPKPKTRKTKEAKPKEVEPPEAGPKEVVAKKVRPKEVVAKKVVAAEARPKRARLKVKTPAGPARAGARAPRKRP